MQRVSELMGKAIVSADSGEKLGTVADLLLDEGGHVAGLVVSSGWMGKEQVLPFDSVQTLGRDAVVARSGRELIAARDWPERVATPGSRPPDSRDSE